MGEQILTAIEAFTESLHIVVKKKTCYQNYADKTTTKKLDSIVWCAFPPPTLTDKNIDDQNLIRRRSENIFFKKR
jgi:hypothetical protein